MQLAIAAGLVSRRTMPLSALGIVALFAVAVAQYGVFHLADYPIFLGFAAYLALRGLQLDLSAKDIPALLRALEVREARATGTEGLGDLRTGAARIEAKTVAL